MGARPPSEGARLSSLGQHFAGAGRALALSWPASGQHSGHMADFFQTGAIATLHRLGRSDVGRLERELCAFAQDSPIALVLPCHSREIGTAALRHIVRELRGVKYLKQVVVGIDQANAKEWAKARRFFEQLPQQPTLIWNSGPRMQRLYQQLEEADLDLGGPGKGRNVWTCFGYVLASEQAAMVAVHDCDILTYSRELLARLCYPVAHPSLGFDFCKGYYARYTTKLNGRVMRLMLTPLLRTLESMLGPHPYLVYMDTFGIPWLVRSAWIWTWSGARGCRATGGSRWACSPRCSETPRPGRSASRSCARIRSQAPGAVRARS
jgi:hypothetical protein